MIVLGDAVFRVFSVFPLRSNFTFRRMSLQMRRYRKSSLDLFVVFNFVNGNAWGFINEFQLLFFLFSLGKKNR
jgi:hypothetical protein